jgi:hypothetical protein
MATAAAVHGCVEAGEARSSRVRLSLTEALYGAVAKIWRILRTMLKALNGNSELVPPGRIRMEVCPEVRVRVTWARKSRLEIRLEPTLTKMALGSWFGSAGKRQAWSMRTPGAT